MALSLERPTVPTRRRIDASEYRRMAEVGILGPDERVELIDGAIITMPPIGDAHAWTVDELTRCTAPPAVAGRAVLRVQGPLQLDELTIPQPDLMLLRPPSITYRTRPPAPADVLLLIEVADSPLAWDRRTKLPRYARHAIPEVWLVDLTARTIEVHREPVGEGYAKVERVTAGKVTGTLVEGLEVDVGVLMG